MAAELLVVEATQMNLYQLVRQILAGTIEGVQVVDGSDLVRSGSPSITAETLGYLVPYSSFAGKEWLFDGFADSEEIPLIEAIPQTSAGDKGALYGFVKRLRAYAARGIGVDSMTAATLLMDHTNVNSDVTYTATVQGTGANDIAVTHTDPSGNDKPLAVTVDETGDLATLLMDHTNANSDVTYTSVLAGPAGNNLKVTHTDPGGNDKLLTVTVTEYATGADIDVSLATGGAGAITTTATELVAAITGSPTASRYVTAVAEGTGAGVTNAKAQASLAGGNNTSIDVSLATGGAGAITTTATELVAAIVGTSAKYVTAVAEGTGAGIVEAKAQANLTGGATTARTATLVMDSTNVNADLTITAAGTGKDYNKWSVALVDPGAINQSIAIVVTGYAIAILLDTDGGGTITTDANGVKTAWDAHATLKTLVGTIAVEGTGAGVVEAIAAANLSGGNDQSDAAKYKPMIISQHRGNYKTAPSLAYASGNQVVFVSKTQYDQFALL